ncbi:hypothetical protein ABZX92_18315 [Lentzea sp. NPDC006480]|uniref:hypothetical protein n=1 Tax=Lentzea sp. NPDC006480 TaxID=3157176 RepID=UPI0033ADAE1B
MPFSVTWCRSARPCLVARCHATANVADSPARARSRSTAAPGSPRLCARPCGCDASHPDPDRWMIVWDAEFDQHTFDSTLTELLVAELTGVLEPQLTDFTVDSPE